MILNDFNPAKYEKKVRDAGYVSLFFDVSFYEGIDIYNEMISLGEHEQLAQIIAAGKEIEEREEEEELRKLEEEEAEADYQKKRLSSVYGRFGDA